MFSRGRQLKAAADSSPGKFDLVGKESAVKKLGFPRNYEDGNLSQVSESSSPGAGPYCAAEPSDIFYSKATSRRFSPSTRVLRYELKTPYRAGTTHVIFERLDFIARRGDSSGRYRLATSLATISGDRPFLAQTV